MIIIIQYYTNNFEIFKTLQFCVWQIKVRVHIFQKILYSKGLLKQNCVKKTLKLPHFNNLPTISFWDHGQFDVTYISYQPKKSYCILRKK